MDLQEKERSIRKKFHSKSASVISIGDLRSFSNFNQRNDIPYKYRSRQASTEHLEAVILQKGLNDAESLSSPQKMSPMTSTILNPVRSTESKPFYYSNQNDILSFDEFFKIYRQNEYSRKHAEKQELRERIESKRNKLNSMKGVAAIKKNLSDLNEPAPPKKIPRCSSSKILSNNSNSRDKVINDLGASLVGRPPSSSQSQFHVSSTRNTSPEVYNVVPQGQELFPSNYTDWQKSFAKFCKADRYQCKSPVPEKDSSLQQYHRESQMDVPHMSATDRGLAFENLNHTTHRKSSTPHFQQLTSKEIHKHLVHFTVSPRKLKNSKADLDYEKSYITLFKNAETMDQRFAINLKRLGRQNSQNNDDHISNEHLLINKPKKDYMYPNTQELLGGPVIKARANSQKNKKQLAIEDPSRRAFIAESITNSKKEIKGLLMRRSSSSHIMNTGDNNAKGEKLQTATRPLLNTTKSHNPKKIILRGEVQKKFNTPTAISRNLDLSNRIKEIKNIVLKQTENSSNIEYTNTKYVDYYIT